MKRVLFTILLTVTIVTLQAQTTILDYLANLPCIERHTVDIEKLPNIIENKIKNLSDIETDFILNTRIYLLIKSDGKHLLFTEHKFSPEINNVENAVIGYLFIDKIEKKCFRIAYVSYRGNPKINNENPIHYFNELSFNYPFKTTYKYLYENSYYIDDNGNEINSTGEFSGVEMRRGKNQYIISSEYIEKDFLHNINKVSYKDFMRITKSLSTRIKKKKYRDFERQLNTKL